MTDRHFYGGKGTSFLYKILEKGHVKNVLDLGAGDGWLAIYCASFGAKVDVVDKTEYPDYLAYHPSIKEYIADIREFEIPDGKTYDLIILSSVLHYLDSGETRSLLGKIKKYVSPKGYIYIFTMTAPTGDRFVHTPEEIGKILDPFKLSSKEELIFPDEGQPDGTHHSWWLAYQAL